MIRNATIFDKDEVRKLVMMAAKLIFVDALKSNDDKLINDLFDKFYTAKNTKFSMENILVFEHDSKVAGCMVWYPASKEVEYNKTMNSILNNGYDFLQEAIPNTYYLDSIAVFEKFRGLSISKKLFEYAIDNSPLDISLLVETSKPTVKAYYERLGFKKVDTVELFNGELDLMILNIEQ